MYTCRMIWMHSPQLPKISTTQHERSFRFFSKISSQVSGSELHWVSLRIGAQKTAFAFVMMCPGGGIGLEYAMSANSAWARSPSAPKEQSNHYHLLHVECVVYYLLAAHFWWCESQKVWLSLRMLPGSVGQKCQLLPPSALLELGGCDLAHLAGSHSWQCEIALP